MNWLTADLLPSPEFAQRLLLVAVLLPLFAALLVQLPARLGAHSLARLLGPLALGSQSVLLLLLWLLLPLLPWPLALALTPTAATVAPIDRLALLLAMVASAAVLVFWSRGLDHPEPSRRDAWMLLLATGLVGLSLAGDVITLYCLVELTTLAGLALITLRGHTRSLIAMLRALIPSALGSLLIVTAIAILVHETQTLLGFSQLAAVDDSLWSEPLARTAIALLLFGLALKVGMFPATAWVGELCAVASGRIGFLVYALFAQLVLVMIARLMVIFSASGIAQPMLVLALLTLLASALAASRARDFPRLLAYSGGIQLGLILLAFALGDTAGSFIGVALLMHHLLIELALFALANRWNGSLRRLNGLATRLPWVTAALVVLVLSLIAIPPLPGFWLRLALIVTLTDSGLMITPLLIVGVLIALMIESIVWLSLLRRLFVPAQLATLPDPLDPCVYPELQHPKAIDAALTVFAGLAVLGLMLTFSPPTPWIEHLLVERALW